jgi:adenine phosphoribosyltransferase
VREPAGASLVDQICRPLIRDVPDYPRPGIVFKDITPLLGDAGAMAAACDAMAAPFRGEGITHVVAIESRGFLFGSVVARLLGAGIVPVRKPGKLPYHRVRVEYALEYGSDAIEMHTDALSAVSRVLVVDDVLATGGTAAATLRLVRSRGAEGVGCSFLIELGFLNGRRLLTPTRIERALAY